MVHVQTEPADGKRVLRSRRPAAVIVAVLLGAALAGYLGLCAYAANSRTIWRGTAALGEDLGGLTVEQAAQKLQSAADNLTIGLYLYDGAQSAPSDRGDTPDGTIAAADLGMQLDTRALAQDAYDYNAKGSFLTAGWRFLHNRGVLYGAADAITTDAAQVRAQAEAAAGKLSQPAQDTAYTMGTDSVAVTVARDGRSVDASALADALSGAAWNSGLALDVPYTTATAKVLTAQEIHDAVASEMKNAGYDAATGSITPEQPGAEFDAAAAQKLLDAAAPGETVQIPATIEQPTVTARQLKAVLFRDKLGSATTHVGGSAARIGNVKLASSTVNGTVLNAGDVFSYNGTVGQRTVAKGYQPAPAYVQGETVDEIGGGVCQPSSTLYLACLRANLEIVQRYAHRYVPAYIAKGMDATVSWGGPDYQFRNDTDYPVKIEAVYAKGYLTMTLYGTKTDNTTVKMTNQVLSTTAWKTVLQNDPTLDAGTQEVKVTPYTGYKVITFRNLYDADGNLVSSKQEATSDYKVRDKLVLVGTKPVATVPASSSDTSAETPADTTTGGTTDTPTDTTTGGTATETPTDTTTGGSTTGGATTGGTTDTPGSITVDGIVIPIQ